MGFQRLRRAIVPVVLAFGVVALPVVDAGAAGRGALVVRVLIDGAGVGGVDVTLQSVTERFQVAGRTGGRGTFRFGALPATSDYVLTVDDPRPGVDPTFGPLIVTSGSGSAFDAVLGDTPDPRSADLGRVPMDGPVLDVAIDAATGRTYATTAGQLVVVGAQGGLLTRRLDLGGADSVAVSGGRLLLAGSGFLTILRTSDLSVVRRVDVPQRQGGVVVATDRVWFLQQTPRQLVAVHPATAAITAYPCPVTCTAATSLGPVEGSAKRFLVAQPAPALIDVATTPQLVAQASPPGTAPQRIVGSVAADRAYDSDGGIYALGTMTRIVGRSLTDTGHVAFTAALGGVLAVDHQVSALTSDSSANATPFPPMALTQDGHRVIGDHDGELVTRDLGPRIRSITPSPVTSAPSEIELHGDGLTPVAGFFVGDREYHDLTTLALTTYLGGMSNDDPEHDLVLPFEVTSPSVVPVRVLTPWGTSEPFEVVLAPTEPPSELSLSRSTGTTAGGEYVRIRGRGLGTVTSASFGGVDVPVRCCTFDPITDEDEHFFGYELEVYAPRHGAGTAPVVVRSPLGDVVVGDYTWVTQQPVVHGSSERVPATGGSRVAIGGTGFLPGSVVHVDDVEATGVIVESGTTISFVAPPHAPGVAALFVQNANGSGSTIPGSGLTYFAPSSIVPVPAQRVLDTRSGARPAAGATIPIAVRSKGEVPSSAAGVVATVTVNDAAGAGFVTVWPCGTPRPYASSVNVDRTGQTIANVAVSGLGPDGRVCAYTSSGAHLLVDVTAWLPAGSSVVTGVPTRRLDTRATRRLRPFEIAEVGVGGTAALLNVTVTAGVGSGWVTVWPCDRERPGTSTVNADRAGQTIAAAAFTAVSGDGRVCVSPSMEAHVIVDVLATTTSESTLHAVDPERIVDTREGNLLVPPEYRDLAPGRAFFPLFWSIRRVGDDYVDYDLPGDPIAVLATVTAVAPSDTGYLTADCPPQPATSSFLNFEKGRSVAGLLVTTARYGDACFTTSARTFGLVDILGYVDI